jgi:predicted metalloprotease with PDZ domain
MPFKSDPMRTFFPRIKLWCLYHDNLILKLYLLVLLFSVYFSPIFSQNVTPGLQYVISIPEPSTHSYVVGLQVNSPMKDSIRFKMPAWMPGYYQMMNYSNSVSNCKAVCDGGESLSIEKTDANTWLVSGIKNRPFRLKYTIQADKQFVANSYTDSAHAYILPENTFMYIEGHLNEPVSVSLSYPIGWKSVATGLDPVIGSPNEYSAPDFDILYDCPILIGNLEVLPSFWVKGIEHRFIAYNIADFDRTLFMNNLKKTVEAATEIIADIPYKQYTFIGIGPGFGGIEHLNNTTISFDGTGLGSPESISRTMNFFGHEYFHNYNVKRIRPFELGPFDYEKGNRTNLLWVSEGLSVYYEYLIVKRAGLIDGETLLANFSGNMNTHENNPGRHFQSLQQASYNTWSDGPFGNQGSDPGKSISYYEKGPLVGLLLDFEIRNATNNNKSLDDVMRLLYRKYYQTEQRGFTDAEFQFACEEVAGISLDEIFEYVYTCKEIDYPKYLAYAGLQHQKQKFITDGKVEKYKFSISRINNPGKEQSAILKSWMGE